MCHVVKLAWHRPVCTEAFRTLVWDLPRFLHQEKDFGLNPATNEYNRVFLLTPVGFRFCCLFGGPEDASTTMLCAQLLCG